jgi:hypothetical protein
LQDILLLDPGKFFEESQSGQADLNQHEKYAYHLGTVNEAYKQILEGVMFLLRHECTSLLKKIKNLVLKSDYHQEREINFLYDISMRQKRVNWNNTTLNVSCTNCHESVLLLTNLGH